MLLRNYLSLLILLSFTFISCKTTEPTTTVKKDKNWPESSLVSGEAMPDNPVNTLNTTEKDTEDRYYQDPIDPKDPNIKLVPKIKKLWTSKKALPEYSTGLSRIAGQLKKFKGKPVEAGSLSSLAAKFGIVSPWMAQSNVVASGYEEEDFIKKIAEVLTAFAEKNAVTHYGFAIMDLDDKGKKVLAVLIQTRKITHEKFYKWVNIGEKIYMKGTMDPDVSKLEVLITLPDGRITRTPVKTEKGKFTFALNMCRAKSWKGKYSIELMGRDSGGPVVLAIFPVACLKESWTFDNKVVQMVIDDKMTPTEFSKKVFESVNEYRKKNKLKPLVWDKTLATVSEAHSIEMCKKGDIYHVSPVTGSPADRTKKAGLKSSLVAENVAMGPTTTSVMNGWIRSEGHRLNLLLKDAKYGGIGACMTKADGSVTWYATYMAGTW